VLLVQQASEKSRRNRFSCHLCCLTPTNPPTHLEVDDGKEDGAEASHNANHGSGQHHQHVVGQLQRSAVQCGGGQEHAFA